MPVKQYKKLPTKSSDLILKPQSGQQEAFLTTSADFCIYGGAAGGGKSYALMLEPLRHIANPKFGAVMFRQSFAQITEEGALWDTSEDIYPLLGAVPKKSTLDWLFASGAKIGFGHLGNEQAKYKYQGSQIPLLLIDELTHFSESVIFYLFSRNRSTCGIRPYIRCTTNPDADSWIAGFIDWWLDDEGFPIPEHSGIVRYFIRQSGEITWSSTREELTNKYPDLMPKSFTFIPAKIDDNQILMKQNPEYLANLQALHPVDQARLLYGNWKVKEESGKLFNRIWFEIVDDIPPLDYNGEEVRFWDLAATEAAVRSNACYTAGVKMRLVDEIYYVVDVIAEQVGPVAGDELMLATAQQDGLWCKVRWELEGGSSGKRDEEHIKQLLMGLHPDIDAEGVRPMGDKVKRAKPLATDTFRGKVKLLRAAWNDRFLSWMHDFPDGKIKDITDAASGAHFCLNEPIRYQTGIGYYKS